MWKAKVINNFCYNYITYLNKSHGDKKYEKTQIADLISHDFDTRASLNLLVIEYGLGTRIDIRDTVVR